jgi:hypothetical protein
VIVDKDLRVLLQFLVGVYGLAICLWVVHGAGIVVNGKDTAEFCNGVVCKWCIVIWYLECQWFCCMG